MVSHIADRLTYCGDIVLLILQLNCVHKNTKKDDSADWGKIFPTLWSWVNTYNTFTTLYIPGIVTDTKLFFLYYWCRIEVLLPLKIQWTKLWCANGPILILMRGFSVVCRYLFWLTILRASRRKNRVVLAPVLDLDLPINSNILRWVNLKEFEYG